MKKLVLAALAASTLAVAGSVQAQSCGGANCWIQQQEQFDPGYDKYQQRTLAATQWHGYAIQLANANYGNYLDENNVRRNTWRRGGKWYKDCVNDHAVAIDNPCYENRVQYPVGYGPQGSTPQYGSQSQGSGTNTPVSSTSWYENGRLIIISTYADGHTETTYKQ